MLSQPTRRISTPTYFVFVIFKRLYLPPANEVCEGYVFTPVCHSVHRGGLPQCMLGCTPGTIGRHSPPQEQTPPEQCMLGDTGNKRALRILLECNLVIMFLLQLKFRLNCIYPTLSCIYLLIL